MLCPSTGDLLSQVKPIQLGGFRRVSTAVDPELFAFLESCVSVFAILQDFSAVAGLVGG